MANLTTTDRRDGSGADLSVTNVAGTATVWTVRYSGRIETNVPVQQYQVIGDDSRLVTLPTGPYIAIVQDDAGPSAPVSFRVSDQSVGVHHRCLLSVRDFILAMNLPSFTDDETRHRLHKKPINTEKELRAASDGDINGCHYFKQESPTPKLSLNKEWEIEYLIWMVSVRSAKGDNRGNTELAADWSHDRQRIIQGLSGAYPLPGNPDVFLVNVTPGKLFGGVSTDYDQQALWFTCRAHIPHGIF